MCCSNDVTGANQGAGTTAIRATVIKIRNGAPGPSVDFGVERAQPNTIIIVEAPTHWIVLALIHRFYSLCGF